MKFDGENAVVNTDTAMTSMLIEAVHNEDGTLKDVKITPVEFDGAGSQTFTAGDGSKLMLWTGFDKMSSVCESITAGEPINRTETYPINTPVTVHAKAYDGYAFMGWYNGDTLVSSDADYTFRLRGNITLTPSFAIEPEVEDIVDFALSADNAFVKADAGNTANISITDAVDQYGTPVTKVTNADASWSSSDENITVDNGVVTVGEGFAADGETDVTITAEINGVRKTCVITFHNYAYYEEMSNADFDGLKMTIAGKDAIVFPGESTTNTYTLKEAVEIGDGTKITYSNAWTGSNTCGQFRTLNFKNSAGETIFSMYYSWGDLVVGGTTLTGAVAKDTWSDVVIEISGSEVTVTANGNSAVTALAGGTKDLASIEFNSASSVPGPQDRALGMGMLKVQN